ncbi:hypothetical protein LSAT2_018182 [Lamellibrachia satsuma]|nr:hypothetical protein LSAT2_018182 [Lamellibrachia satsuma]
MLSLVGCRTASVNQLFLYNTALTFCSTGTSLSIFRLNYEMLVVYTTLFGLFIGELRNKLHRDVSNTSCSATGSNDDSTMPLRRMVQQC